MRLEPASFEVEHFELDANACLEVRGRWFGVHGRRFMRPALTTVCDGREQRILAVLDHKPWNAEDGEIWHAAFPCSIDPAELARAELTVAPDVTVALPPLAPAKANRGARGASPRDTSREQAPLELDRVVRDLERVQEERDAAIAARAAAIDERQQAIEREVGERIAELRVEFERERAGARLAAQTAHERDEARAAREEVARERDEAAGERDEAIVARDKARQERNRILAQRDAARARVEEATRQWELTAALGTRRTLERDALAVERDRAIHDLEKAREELHSVAGERDVALEACDRFADERDTVIEACERASRERDAALQAREKGSRERDAALQDRDRARIERDAALLERDRAIGTGGAPRQHDAAVQADEPPAEEGTIELPARTPPSVDLAAPSQRRAPRPAAPPRSSEPAARPRRFGDFALAPGARSGFSQDPAELWRARLLAISALLVAVVVLLVLLLAK
jgi:hypothetical protein